MSREVITESHATYGEYEGCVADAKSKGYVFRPSQFRLAPTGSHPVPAAVTGRRGKQPA